MIPLRLLGGVGGVALLIGAIGGWQVRTWKAHADEAKFAAAATAEREAITARYSAAAQDFENQRRDGEVVAAQVQTRIKEVYRDVKVPGDCAVPDSAVGLLEGARARVNATIASEPGNAVQADRAAASAVH